MKEERSRFLGILRGRFHKNLLGRSLQKEQVWKHRRTGEIVLIHYWNMGASCLCGCRGQVKCAIYLHRRGEVSPFIGISPEKFLENYFWVADPSPFLFPIKKRRLYPRPEDGPWAPPLRNRRDYTSYGRKTFLVEALPDSVLPDSSE